MSGIFPSAPRKLPKVKGCTQPAAHSLLVFLLLSSVFVDVEELCYFIEVLVLLPVFDDLEEGEHMKSCTSHKRARAAGLSQTMPGTPRISEAPD